MMLLVKSLLRNIGRAPRLVQVHPRFAPCRCRRRYVRAGSRLFRYFAQAAQPPIGPANPRRGAEVAVRPV